MVILKTIITIYICVMLILFKISFSCFLFYLSLVSALTVSVEPTVDNADLCKAPTKKQQGKRKEAASQRLLAVGHKIKHVFISG